ncbi:NADH-quinone oxidoreductase subunit L [Sorangium cellulosum]|uniref:NADH dehydrogenase n=1 Tax=Sorangium cellulosum TaxID=56 RepID=A0A150Q5R7_SORCE|nr:proton-conducting transporter membrane subunit [Sorangium cellulosum]KYF63274.1 NADH dehydrogenase [Sorangium cellulosum]
MPDYSGQVTHVHASLTPLWWIPLLPLLGAAVNALFGRALQRSAFGRDLSKRLHIGSLGVTLVAVGAMLGAFALGLANFVQLAGLAPGERALYSFAWKMVRIGSLDANFAFLMDPLSGVMTLIITGVGALIHVYAAAYMEAEPAYWRFFTYLNLFVFSMLLLVLGDNFIVMFFGWEGVGLCSYLLIGFWYGDYKKASAGMKAFVVNRVGDWGFVCGLALLFWGLGARWLDDGRYLSDYRARFIAVSGEAHGEQGASAGTRDAAGGKAGERRTQRLAGAKGSLTFTGHPGARVYLGIANAAQLASNPPPFGVSPFIRKEIDAGVHSVVIVPGDGAVIGGDGLEIAAIDRMRVEPGKEVVVATVGSTVTFREIHDQLVIKDASGKAFLKDALESKTVWGGVALVTLACLFLFVGAAGKSAQIPLHVWLPDAMAGPTPVSALIHAATMVTAGVYLIARLNFVYALSPVASGIVALVGASTALFAATIGFFQYDIKKVLAYSTVSQLGFMFIGVGVGAYWAAVFHLMTHAFFKACLFLGSGSVIHGMHAVEHDEAAAQDMRNMGGLRRVMPRTARTYQVACIAITAAPIPFLAGFWSKDEILWKAFGTENTGPIPGLLLYGMGLAAALGTSFYMWRSYYLTFEGPHARKEIKTKVHESPAAITGVLAVLALLSALAGVVFGFSSHFIGGHGEPLLEEWLHPVFAHAGVSFQRHGLGLELALMAISVGGAIGAFSLARARYGARRSPRWESEERRLPGFQLLSNKYYVDEIYGATVVRAFLSLRLFFAEMDRWIVDGLVNAVAVLARAAAWVTGAIDRHLVDGVVNVVAEGTLSAGEKLRSLQTGRIQSYIYFLLGGVALFSIVHYFLR